MYGDKGYWKDAYQIIRQANALIQDLPNHSDLAGYEEWIGEARFIRAYTYYALVKRYGGVPIVKEPQPMADDVSQLYVARNSHEECVDFILEDLDYAMQHMSADKVNGRANKFVAAAVKARVALYAGSVARYGQAYNYTGQTGTMLTGLPEERANDYFQQAFAATLEVEKGGYALHTGSDKRQAFYEVFDNAASSEESVFIREYDITNYVHSWDKLMAPERMVGYSYGGRYFVPLDWVELFDGLPIDPATGFLKTTDDEGNYIVYESAHALFDNAEPRLKASIMIPGDTYKGGYELDMRAGLITSSPDKKSRSSYLTTARQRPAGITSARLSRLTGRPWPCVPPRDRMTVRSMKIPAYQSVAPTALQPTLQTCVRRAFTVSSGCNATLRVENCTAARSLGLTYVMPRYCFHVRRPPLSWRRTACLHMTV